MNEPYPTVPNRKNKHQASNSHDQSRFALMGIGLIHNCKTRSSRSFWALERSCNFHTHNKTGRNQRASFLSFCDRMPDR